MVGRGKNRGQKGIMVFQKVSISRARLENYPVKDGMTSEFVF